ncbi:hypothetical protein KIN20_031552 [Parelaphostrongylus tenuis]|uniref:Uncharacterized protein n=1 Tax=Parelaphostrongylus tenuis TaxID=148309 RepID=A0AAD5WHQ1_PARTN|nr:hypothetical protein KIN20_031552 [Parelaphostrongylus tenuis]
MVFLANKAGIPTDHFVILLPATISTVFGCGVMPPGQGSTRNFTVTGFTLLSPWLTPSQLLSRLKFLVLQLARQWLIGFVERLVMQTVFDVLESQARSALLPDAVISAILSQLTVTINYTPLECPNTTNVIMASWSRAMWQSVVNRAIRMLASDPFRKHFFSAVTIVGGN